MPSLREEAAAAGGDDPRAPRPRTQLGLGTEQAAGGEASETTQAREEPRPSFEHVHTTRETPLARGGDARGGDLERAAEGKVIPFPASRREDELVRKDDEPVTEVLRRAGTATDPRFGPGRKDGARAARCAAAVERTGWRSARRRYDDRVRDAAGVSRGAAAGNRSGRNAAAPRADAELVDRERGRDLDALFGRCPERARLETRRRTRAAVESRQDAARRSFERALVVARSRRSVLRGGR